MLRRAFLRAPAVEVLRGRQEPSAMFGDASAYDRFMGRWSRLVAQRMLGFTGLPRSGEVLDVGSGTGSLAFAIASRRPQLRVVGIDPSQEYVNYARSMNSPTGQATFEVGDAQKLRFAGMTFDAALSLLVFNFIPDPSKALAELRRVVKPGGRISAAVWDYGGKMLMLRTFWAAALQLHPGADIPVENNMPLCRHGELSALWRGGGLTDVREAGLEIEMRFSSFPDYWDPFLLGQGPAGRFVRKLEPRAKEALRSELKRRLAPSAEDAPFTLPARVWAVYGRNPAHA